MSFTHRNSQSDITDPAATTLVLLKPVGLAVGDLMIASIGKDDDVAISAYPSGWTIMETAGTTAGNDVRSWFGYKVADAADVAATDFTWTADAEMWSGTISAFIPGNGNPAHVQHTPHLLRTNQAQVSADVLPVTSTDGNMLIGACISAQADTGGLTTNLSNYTVAGNPTTGTGNGDNGSMLCYDVTGGTVQSFYANNAEATAESHAYLAEFSDEEDNDRSGSGSIEETHSITATGVKFDPAVDIEQKAFRFRDDTVGLNVDGGWLGALNEDLVDIDVTSDVTMRLRWLFENDGDLDAPTTTDWYFVKQVDGGAWGNLNSGTGTDIALSTQYANNDPTTQLIGSGTFSAGDGTENEPGTFDIGLVQGSETEFEIVFTLLSAELSHGDVINFRIYVGPGDAYRGVLTETPSITVVKPELHSGSGSIVETHSITASGVAYQGQPILRESEYDFDPASSASYGIGIDGGDAVEGDLAIIHILGSSSSGPVTEPGGVPAGWTKLYNTSNGDYAFSVWWKILTAADLAASDVDFAFDAAGYHAHQLDIIEVETFDASSPIETTTLDTRTAGNTVDAEVDTNVAYCLMLSYAGEDISQAETFSITDGIETVDVTLGAEYLHLGGYQENLTVAGIYTRAITTTATLQDIHCASIAISPATGNKSSSASVVETHSVTATGVKAAAGIATISVTATPTAIGASGRSSIAAIAETHSVTATGDAVEFHTGTASIVAVEAVTATGDKAGESDASIAVGHSATAVGSMGAADAASIVETHTVTATGVKAVTVVEQKGFRFRDDTVGLNVDSGWLGVLNQDITLLVSSDKKFRLRFIMENDGTEDLISTTDWWLFHRVNSGSWETTGAVRFDVSSEYTNGEATTQLIGSGTFSTGEGVHGAIFADDVGLASGDETEIEFMLEAQAGDLSEGDVLEFELTYWDGGFVSPQVTTETPTITVTKINNINGSGAITETHSVTAVGFKNISDTAEIGTVESITATGDKAASSVASISHGHSVVATGVKSEGSDDRFGSGSIVETHSVVATGTKAVAGTASITTGHTVTATGVKAEPIVEQKAFRFRYDNAALNADTDWVAPLNDTLDNLIIEEDVYMRLRILVENTGDYEVVSGSHWWLFVRRNTQSWSLPSLFGVTRATPTIWYDNQDPTTQVIGAGTFAPGKGVEDATSATSVGLPVGEETEFEFAFKFQPDYSNAGDLIEFKLEYGVWPKIGMETVTEIPSVTVAYSSGPGIIDTVESVTAAGVKAASSDVAISHGHAVTATGYRTEADARFGSGSIANTASITATGVKGAARAVTIDATATPVAVGDKAAVDTAAISGVTAITATGIKDDGSSEPHEGSGTIVETAAVTATGSKDSEVFANIQSFGELTATGVAHEPGQDVTLDLDYTITATGVKGAESGIALETVVELAGEASKGAQVEAAIMEVATLTATWEMWLVMPRGRGRGLTDDGHPPGRARQHGTPGVTDDGSQPGETDDLTSPGETT